MYDDEENWYLKKNEPWMKNFATFVGANVQCHDTGRLRRGYDDARDRWDRGRKTRARRAT